jgi:hypothetical protein
LKKERRSLSSVSRERSISAQRGMSLAFEMVDFIVNEASLFPSDPRIFELKHARECARSCVILED